MVRWIIQNNLINENDTGQMQKACRDLGILYEEVKAIPFSPELPKFTIDETPNIYYGAITFMQNVYEQLNNPTGLFFDPETFTMENYLKHWGEHMLSSEATITTFPKFIMENHEPDSLWFIRPNEDSKAFAGTVMSYKDIRKWAGGIFTDSSEVVGITEDTKILVGEPYKIKKEWRNFVVDGKVVTSSRYREEFGLSKSATDIPDSMIQFIEDRIKEYKPHDVFAIDIGLCGDKYYIIECGCVNSMGFYEIDIFQFIKSISEYVENSGMV